MCSVRSPPALTATWPTPPAGIATETSAAGSDQARICSSLDACCEYSSFANWYTRPDITTPAGDADAGRGRMRQPVVAGDHAADAERRQKRRHDAGAEDARPAVIARRGRRHRGRRRDRRRTLADEQHDEQHEEPERRDGRVDEHAGVTLHPQFRDVK